MAGLANEIASTLQTASIKHDPDPAYDLDPSTSASKKRPVQISNVEPLRRLSSYDPTSHPPRTPYPTQFNVPASHSDDDIPMSVIQPAPRHHNLPPLPDMRFEQSYLARIKHCQSAYSVAWVTFLDHVIMPLTQGIIWNLAVFGWRTWNRGVKFQGSSVGARVRRWWWNVNGWKVPEATTKEKAENLKEYFVAQAGSATGD